MIYKIILIDHESCETHFWCKVTQEQGSFLLLFSAPAAFCWLCGPGPIRYLGPAAGRNDGVAPFTLLFRSQSRLGRRQ